MGTFTYQIPALTQPNSTEDAKIATALTTLLTWGNGNIDGSNIATTAGFYRLTPAVMGSNATATAGTLVGVTPGVTCTLPAPAANIVLGIYAGVGVTGASPVTVNGTNIYGVGLSGASTFKLGVPLASVLLQSDGTNWFIVAGQQDTGWVTLSLPAGWGTYVFGDPAAARLIGDTVRLRGTAQNNSGGALGLNITIPTPFRPPANRFPSGPFIGSFNVWQFTSVSNLNFGNVVTANFVEGLDGIVYSVV